MSDTLIRLTDIFRRQFRDPHLILKMNTSAKDITRWDSFAQISLVLAIEEQFNIKLPTHKVMEMQNIGEMVSYIDER